jgi:hypothetical protein
MASFAVTHPRLLDAGPQPFSRTPRMPESHESWRLSNRTREKNRPPLIGTFREKLELWVGDSSSDKHGIKASGLAKRTHH